MRDTITDMEDKLYNVTFRAKSNPVKLEAATVKREGGRLIFTNTKGEETGNYNDADVAGYAAEPEPPSGFFSGGPRSGTNRPTF
jgi:hypothetical protein